MTCTKDIRGSVQTLISESGTKLVGYNYDDYGKTSISVANANTAKAGYNNHICYTGGVYDKATGRYYLNARYYTPDTLNFLTKDTYRGTDKDSKTWNLYGYCAGNPVGYMDPSGHFVETIFDIISIGMSAYDLVTNPSLSNAGFFVWDVAAACVPVATGSYSVKAVSKASGAIKAADKAADAAKGVKKVTKTVVSSSKKAARSVVKKTVGSKKTRNLLEKLNIQIK